MPYPPPVPPNTRTNSTPSVENHPTDHNMISVALTEILNHIAQMEATFNPVGIMQIYTGDVPPTNWMLCQGQVLDRTTYATLFAVVGTRFNTGGETATQFRIPTMQGRAPFGFWSGGGWANVMGALGGRDDTPVIAHAHTVNFWSGGENVDHSHSTNFNTSDVSSHHDHLTTVGVFFHDPFAPGFGITVNQGQTLPANYGQIPVSMAGNHVHAVIGGTSGRNPGHQHPITGSTDNAGGGTAGTNLPPFVALNFIIRVL